MGIHADKFTGKGGRKPENVVFATLVGVKDLLEHPQPADIINYIKTHFPTKNGFLQATLEELGKVFGGNIPIYILSLLNPEKPKYVAQEDVLEAIAKIVYEETE